MESDIIKTLRIFQQALSALAVNIQEPALRKQIHFYLQETEGSISNIESFFHLSQIPREELIQDDVYPKYLDDSAVIETVIKHNLCVDCRRSFNENDPKSVYRHPKNKNICVECYESLPF